MTFSKHRPTLWAQATLLLLLAVLLISCGTPPQQEEEIPDPAPPVEPDRAAAEQIESLPASAYREQFNAAEQALAQFDWQLASSLLADLPTSTLTGNDKAYYLYLDARAHYLRGDQPQAETLAEQASGETDHLSLLYRISTFRHFMLSLSGEHTASAAIAAGMLPWLDEDRLASWKRLTWQNLERASDQELQEELEAAIDADWMAWLQLALDSRADDGSGLAVSRWLSQHPGHIAADPLPGGWSATLSTPPYDGRVALLLPLNGRLGPAGKAVMEGYLAAYYAGAADGQSQGDLIILDESAFPSAHDAYAHAVQHGAGMLVGPLSKSGVAELSTLPERQIPILALNRVDSTLPATGSALVQLSLSPEDEALTLSQAAFGRGARTALIMRPQGNWGDKVESAMRQNWSSLGGTVVSGISFAEPEAYSDSVKAALGLNESQQRARQVRDMLATNIEFTPRRRKDIDAIFLLSRRSTEARAIKPLLAFHYAGNIPVYSLSSINTGLTAQASSDLKGTRLVEMPWLLGTNQELRMAIAAGDTGSDQLTRLNALGADAFLVQRQFARLQSGPDTLFRGNTGLLTLDPQLHLRRELTLARIDGGGVRPE